MSSKIRVGVIFGGRSGEHEVSVQSARSIVQSLDPEKYEVVPIGIDKSGKWHIGSSAKRMIASSEVSFLTDSAHPTGYLGDMSVTEETAVVPSSVVQEVDVFIPALHGSYGEDGTVQGMMEMLDVPYVGAGVLASAVGMDKTFMKRLFAAAGLPQVNYTFFTRKEFRLTPDEVMTQIEESLGYPCFVKPANLGSSVGISKAKDRPGLEQAIHEALRFDRKVIVEEGLNVREVEVAVLGNEQPKASVAGEVVPSNEFYDYRAKYVDGDSALIIPAPLTDEAMEDIRRLAVAAYQAIDCTGLARVDFFVEKETEKILVNEINTMPGFTQFSMYPKLWEATGLSYAHLIDTLIELAMQNHQEKRMSETDFQMNITSTELV